MSDMWDAPADDVLLRQGACHGHPHPHGRPPPRTPIDTGDTAWLLAASALVLLMAPGLALFYGGMVRSKSVLNMMMMTFGALAAITIIWVLVGYSLAFGDDLGLGLLGNPLDHFGLQDLVAESADSWLTVPIILFAIFQGLFCVITGALVSGAIADRARFGAWMVFVSAWTVLVYAPIAHWVFDFDREGHVGGWLANRIGTIDFAGGMAVEICSGASALALALVVGTRVGFGNDAMRPHNLTLVMLGAGLLWFGWYGFNAGSALGANHTAAVVFVTTSCAAAAGAIGWLTLERFRDGHATTLGAASGMVAGLVAITPSGGSLTPIGALVMGMAAGVDLRAGRRAEVPLAVRRLAGRRRRAPGRRAGRHDRHRPAGHLGRTDRGRRAALRRRRRPARTPAARLGRGAGLRLPRLRRDRLGGAPDDGLPDRRGARGDRDRPGDPRGDGVRPALDRRCPQQRGLPGAEGDLGPFADGSRAPQHRT